MEEMGIYIHIPFCKQKCYYCDFVSCAGMTQKVKPYMEAVAKEIDSYHFTNFHVTTIYIGGGTPSFIDSKYIVNILEMLKQKLVGNRTKWEDLEITLEGNPGTLTKRKLEDYHKAGVNRLSIGLQSSNNEILKQIGRIHTVEEFTKAHELAKQVGFTNINVDLMIGLPSQTMEDVKKSLQKVVALQPKHISVYSLILEEGTVLADKVEKGILKLPSEEIERHMYWYVKNTLEREGYIHYEISNFARNGFTSKHNMNCWEQKEYIGFGVAAHSYWKNVRYSNCDKIEDYIINMDKSKEKRYLVQEIQSQDEKQKEYMLLGLRKIKGVCISDFKSVFGVNPIFLFRREWERLTKQGLVEMDGDFIRLSEQGIDFANVVWEEFV